MCSRLHYEEMDSGVLEVKRVSKFVPGERSDMMKEEDYLQQNNAESLPPEKKTKMKYLRVYQLGDGINKTCDDQQLLGIKREEDPNQWSSSLDQQDVKVVQVKKEEDKLWTDQEGEQLTVKREEDGKPEVFQLRSIKTEDTRDAEPSTISSDPVQVKQEVMSKGNSFKKDDLQLFVIKKEEDPHLLSSRLDQQDIVLIHVKKEEEELWTNQEGEQLTVKREDYEKPEVFQLHPNKTKDNRDTELQTISSAEQMETETNGNRCGRPEPDRNHDPNINLKENAVDKSSDSSETEDSSDDADYWKKTVSVSGSAKEHFDKKWREILTSKLRAKSNRGRITAKQTFSRLERRKTFPTKQQFQKHKTPHSAEEPSSLFDKNNSRKKQKVVMNDNQSFTCLDCGKIFINTPQLKYHMRLHTGEKPFHCELCDEKFGSQKTLNHHMLIHEEEKPFACSRCDKCYKFRTNLLAHIKSHSAEKPFHCGVCDKTFTLRGNLNQHLLIHKDEKPFACSRCDKRFRVRRDLQAHMTSHSGEKPFCCFDCGATFSRRETANRHVKLHKGGSPYACDKCDKIFLQVSHLKRHTLIHLKGKVSVQHDEVSSKPRPFACEECGKKFFQKSHLTVHRTVHSRRKPFNCEICGVSFTRKDTWGRHKLKFH